MSYQTYTCVVCGKTGLTKRNSYQYASGRACRDHKEVAMVAEHRLHPEKFDKRLKAVWYVERFINTMHFNLPISCRHFDITAIEWIVKMMEKALELQDICTPEFIREMIRVLKDTVPYKETTHWYLDLYIENLEAWDPNKDLACEFSDLLGQGRDQLFRIHSDMKNVSTYEHEAFTIWKLITDLVKFYKTNQQQYDQYRNTIIDTLHRRISLAMCIDSNETAKLDDKAFSRAAAYLSFIVKVRTLIKKKESGLKDAVFIDTLNCVIKANKGVLFP